MGTLQQKWGPNGDPKTEKGPHGDRVPQMGTHVATVPTLKVLSVRLHSKSHQKSSKCQNLLTGWHLEKSCKDQFKKPPCIINFVKLQKNHPV